MELKTLHDCFVTKLMALYDIESELVKALPKLIKGVSSAELQESMTKHFAETESQVERLEKIFSSLDLPPKKLKVEAIRGLADDAAWIQKQEGSPEALDMLIASAASYVENYEMAGYRMLLEWSKKLGLTEAEELLTQSMAEEEEADRSLTEFADSVELPV